MSQATNKPELAEIRHQLIGDMQAAIAGGNIEKLADWTVDFIGQELSKCVKEAHIQRIKLIDGTLLADTTVLASQLGEEEMQSYFTGYKMAYKEVEETCSDMLYELQTPDSSKELLVRVNKVEVNPQPKNVIFPKEDV